MDEDRIAWHEIVRYVGSICYEAFQRYRVFLDRFDECHDFDMALQEAKLCIDMLLPFVIVMEIPDAEPD